jgi:hypothetical protein
MIISTIIIANNLFENLTGCIRFVIFQVVGAFGMDRKELLGIEALA